MASKVALITGVTGQDGAYLAELLLGKGYEVQHVAANMADEAAIGEVVALHREKYGRLDVLVNNAGVGIGAAAGEQQSKYVDLQLDVNLRAIILFYRECLEMLKSAGGEHRHALVVNLASMSALRSVPKPGRPA